MIPRPSGKRATAAWTLVEILVGVGILAVLVTLILAVGWPRMLASAEKTRCMSNLRSLHSSLNSYVQTVGHWPQVPSAIDVSSSANDAAYEDWWLNELKDYGGDLAVWQCPTIKRLASRNSPDGRPKIHYTPTPFDAKAFTPFRWKTQPWLIEIANAHGHGALLCFSDGSVRQLDDVKR